MPQKLDVGRLFLFYSRHAPEVACKLEGYPRAIPRGLQKCRNSFFGTPPPGKGYVVTQRHFPQRFGSINHVRDHLKALCRKSPLHQFSFLKHCQGVVQSNIVMVESPTAGHKVAERIADTLRQAILTVSEYAPVFPPPQAALANLPVAQQQAVGTNEAGIGAAHNHRDSFLPNSRQDPWR